MYKVYQIPKRGKDKREKSRIIAQPSKELKFIQKYVIENYFSILPVHPSALAYKKGTSIKKNAVAHSKSSFLLKMDFKNFFPSIKPADFTQHIRKYINDFSNEDTYLVENLFFLAA